MSTLKRTALIGLASATTALTIITWIGKRMSGLARDYDSPSEKLARECPNKLEPTYW